MNGETVCAERPGPVAPAVADNLRRWVSARQGRWTHAGWLGLLESLRLSSGWPPAPAAVRDALEQAREEWRNLRR